VEAPPGFEPGVEVLQTGSAITKLLSRLAFWSALIRVLHCFRRVLFPDCSQVHFSHKLLIFDPASIIFRSFCSEVVPNFSIAKSSVDEWERIENNWRTQSEVS
jgi:hypothetical protein